MQSPSEWVGARNHKLRRLSVLPMTETNSDESRRALLRLLVDEIVEDLSRSGNGWASRSVQKPIPSMDDVVVLG